MFEPGVFPATVTPCVGGERLDVAGLERLIDRYRRAGCKGIVLGGTNGEGPSLSSSEKNELVGEAAKVRGELKLIVGVATSSLGDASATIDAAAGQGVDAALVMPPMYFREASREGIESWFRAVLDRSPIPVLVYNLPKRTGVALWPELLRSLADHPRFAGAKDSSGDRENLASYAEALRGRGKTLLVGDETLLIEALDAGWTGTISGAANVVPTELASIVAAYPADRSRAREEFQQVLPTIQALRGARQPGTNKAVLAHLGLIDASVWLPLIAEDPAVAVRDLIASYPAAAKHLDAKSEELSAAARR